MSTDMDLLAALAATIAAVSPAPPIDTAALTDASLDQWRALTTRHPWIEAIVLDDHEPKRVEVRTRKTSRRGWILLHAGKGYDATAADRFYVRQWMKRADYGCGPLGAIVGAAVITGCHEAAGCCAPWGDPGLGSWHWTLAHVRRLAEPVPCRGALGFWKPPRDVLAAVLEQLGGAR